MNKKFFFTAILTALFQLGFAQCIDKAKLDNYFNALAESNKFMGSVAVLEDGKLTYTKTIGYSDIESKQMANENTKYKIGSVSKTFTSSLIFKAIEENKISLDTNLSKFFPNIKNADKITISNLLNHRSGIHNFTDNLDYLSWNTQKKSESEMIAIINKSASEFEPNSKAEYSNSNYLLLSYILQKLYKKPYSEILNEKIIKPLGLKNTYLSGKINAKNNESNSYKFDGKWTKETETDSSIPLGAGAIFSTPIDLAKFANALFNGKVVSDKSLKQMEEIKDGYGYGLFQIPFGDKKSFGHTGGIDGFSSVYGYFPNEKVAFALTSNASNYNNNNIALAILNAVFNHTYDIPNFKGIELKSEDLDKYLGTYSGKDFPMKITVTKDGKTLMAQATGQQAFPLDATEKDTFSFDRAGIKLVFDPSNKTMTLNQGGMKATLTKE